MIVPFVLTMMILLALCYAIEVWLLVRAQAEAARALNEIERLTACNEPINSNS